MDSKLIAVINYALDKHQGQLYGTKPYYYHLDGVYSTYNHLFGEIDVHTGMLIYSHDLLEDTDAEISKLLNLGMDTNSINDLVLLTKSKVQSNTSYLDGILTSKRATMVKIADSTSNLNESLKSGNTRLIGKYVNNLVKLYGGLNENLE